MEYHMVEIYASKTELPEEQENNAVLEQTSQKPTSPTIQSIPQISTLSDVYKCHICNVNVPKTHKTEHNGSFKHKTYLRIANEALERIRENMNEENNSVIVKTDNSTHFCDNCDAVMQITDKEKHEESDSHTLSVIYDKLLSVLYTTQDTSKNNSDARDKEISKLATEIAMKHFIKYINDTFFNRTYKNEAKVVNELDTLKNTNKCGPNSTSVQHKANDDNSDNSLLVTKGNNTDIDGKNNKDAALAQNMAGEFENNVTSASPTQNAVGNKTDYNIADNRNAGSTQTIAENISNKKNTGITQSRIATDNMNCLLSMQTSAGKNTDNNIDAALGQNTHGNIAYNNKTASIKNTAGSIVDNREASATVQNAAGNIVDNREASATVQNAAGNIVDNREASATVQNAAGNIVDNREASATVQNAAGNAADSKKGATSTQSTIFKDAGNKSAALSQNTEINIYKCKLCNVSVPNNAHNINEHIGGLRHKTVLELVLKSPAVRRLGSAVHCRLCDFLFSETNIVAHLMEKHETEVLDLRLNITNTKSTRESNKQEIIPIIEQDKYVQCFVCNKSIINDEDMIKSHENENSHKVTFQNILTANQIKTYNNTHYCEACRTSLNREDVVSHVSSFIHLFNMKSVHVPKDLAIQYECKNNEMVCKVCKVLVHANLKELESHIQSVNHHRNVSSLANGIRDIMKNNYIFSNGDYKPTRKTVPTKPAFLGRKTVIAFRRRSSEKTGTP